MPPAPVVFPSPALLLVALGITIGAATVLSGQTSRPPRAAPLWSGARPAATFTPLDDAFLEELSRASFRYFVEQAHSETGLIRDRARADASPSEGKASIAGSGFALAGWAIATHRGWVERSVALEHVRRSLRFLAERAPRHRGFFYHFMEMDTGERSWNCELSSIDTALFLTGALVAREYFQDSEITGLVNRLYAETDWKWFLNDGSIVVLGWRPETGFSRYRWSSYSEHMMMPLLGLGAPLAEHALAPEHWRAWSREPVGSYDKWTFLQGPPLFMHQFTHAYFDFRGRRDAFADYYRNSLLATLAQRQMSIDLRTEFPAWGEMLWGVTASDSATGYKGWGMPPRTINYNALDGTIVPCAAAGSIPFAPYETLLALRHMRTVYGDRIWGRYGFADAFNPHTGWVNPDVIGIDVGITLLMAENARSGFVWALFMQAPEIQRAMELAGFLSTSRDLSWSETAAIRRLAAQTWELLAEQPLASETAGLQITAALAAQALGLTSVEEAARRVETMIKNTRQPETETALAYYAASLLTSRQAYPSVAAVATKRFDAIDWTKVSLTSDQLGASSRLTAFLQVATGMRTAEAWTDLQRTPESFGPVYVLSPARMEDQFLPGIWLAEDEIITGASASQLAYAIVMEQRAAGRAGRARSIFATALLLDHFPAEFVDDMARTPLPEDWVVNASPAERAAFVISVANLLVPDCVRRWFQQDPLVQAARRAIPEFAEAAFGTDTSVMSRRQLAGPMHVPPERVALARPASTPRDEWDWHTMAGQEFKESAADVWPSDPALELRFAFTWDDAGLRFHAVAFDTPPGYERSPKRSEVVELYVDPQHDGLVWADPADLQFVYESRGAMREGFRSTEAVGEIRRTSTGYEVDGLIPWEQLGVEPRPGLTIGVSPAIVRAGPTEVDPSLKLNWRFFRRLDERIALATLRLE